MDYDSISHALILNGFWSHAPSPAGWTENIRQDEGVTDKVEIGVLSQETSSDVEELKLGGFLTVVGEDIKPSPLVDARILAFSPLTSVQNPPSSPSHPAITLYQATPPSAPPLPTLPAYIRSSTSPSHLHLSRRPQCRYASYTPT